MYIENKAEGLAGGTARIGRVSFSKTGKTIYYRGHSFRSLKGGYKANYFDTETLEGYWISGPRKDGEGRLYGERVPVEIDDDVREEYWREIRGLPEWTGERET
ncbi:MAG: 1-deoxy-D-xylulose-5-phosphate synthase [bacterium]|nr:1-deoxy-D-xylulose-5-phosphate synthase [bacterium]